MASSMALKIACAMLLFAAAAAPLAQAAINCGDVTMKLAPCLSFLLNGGAVSAACCNGVKSLNDAAKTTPDRQQTCSCLKADAANYPINLSNAAALPGKCGVNIPYNISPDIDCKSVS